MKVFELKGTADQLILEYKNLGYQFDQKIRSGSGILFGLQISTSTNNKIIPYNKAHKLLEHANSIVNKAAMKNWDIASQKMQIYVNTVLWLSQSRKMCLKSHLN